jgi:SAM-dependent methyltransferase
MSMKDAGDHWNAIYRTKQERDVSWFETVPVASIEMMESAGLTVDTCVVDIGGGQSRLVDTLLQRGLHCLGVLDISGEALQNAQSRVGAAAVSVTWIESDVTAEWSLPPVDIWHDRAVFHFLVESEERIRYVRHMRRTIKAGGTAIIATFATDGPDECSGLPVARYSPAMLAAELGPAFELVEARTQSHVTPWGAVQSFQYSRFRYAGVR